MVEMSQEIRLKVGRDAHSERKQRPKESLISLDVAWQTEVKVQSSHWGFHQGMRTSHSKAL